MPWYYAGPEAKPVGPVSLDELHSLRVRETIKPETYVIQHTGLPDATWAWKRYRDVFPASPSLPPPPPLPLPLPASVAPAHPLFPSAAPASTQPGFPVAPPSNPYAQIKPTNGWCGWGFGLGLAGFVSSFICIGLIPALLALPICIVGLVKVSKHREQSGQGLAIAGLIFSGIALLISSVFVLSFALPMIKAHDLTVTEETSNDSE